MEAFAVGGVDVVIGAGAERARRAGAELAAQLDEQTAVALVGVAGGLAPELRTGDLVIASELRTTESSEARQLPGMGPLAAEFRRAGLGVLTGPLVSSPRYVGGGEREALAASGAVAVDMESAWVMGCLPKNPLAVIRSISDTSECGPVLGGVRALGSLLAVRRPLERWARACGEHEVVIPKIEQLHRTLAMAVIEKRTRLTAAEVRFLRKYLGWSGVDFARHMGVTAESVSRWENDREQMAAVADRLLRLMVVTKAPVSEYSLDDLMDLDEKSAPVRLRVAPKKGGWLAEVQAA